MGDRGLPAHTGKPVDNGGAGRGKGIWRRGAEINAGFRRCYLSGRFFCIHDMSLHKIESVQTRLSKFE